MEPIFQPVLAFLAFLSVYPFILIRFMNTQLSNITHGGSKYESEWFLVVDNRND